MYSKNDLILMNRLFIIFCMIKYTLLFFLMLILSQFIIMLIYHEVYNITKTGLISISLNLSACWYMHTQHNQLNDLINYHLYKIKKSIKYHFENGEM